MIIYLANENWHSLNAISEAAELFKVRVNKRLLQQYLSQSTGKIFN